MSKLTQRKVSCLELKIVSGRPVQLEKANVWGTFGWHELRGGLSSSVPVVGEQLQTIAKTWKKGKIQLEPFVSDCAPLSLKIVPSSNTLATCSADEVQQIIPRAVSRKLSSFFKSFCYSKPSLVHASNKCSVSCKTCTKVTVPSVERIKLEFYNLSLIAKNARIWKRRGSMVYQGT